ncbi:hypothetical protein Tco_1256423 [Tanacetum coccineum]
MQGIWYNRESIRSKSNTIMRVDSERIKMQCPVDGGILFKRWDHQKRFPSKKRNRPSLLREPSTIPKVKIGPFKLNIKTLENVIEDEPHLFMEIVDNDLHALTMITKHFVSERGKGIIRSQCRSCGGNSGRGGSMSGRGGGWLAKCSIVLNEGVGGGGLVVRGEVIGSGVELGVIKSSSDEIPSETMGERGWLTSKAYEQLVLPGPYAAWNHPSVMKGTNFCRTTKDILF